MLSSEFLRRQAARCLRIAAAVDDQSVVAALVVMADDFSVKADEIDPKACFGKVDTGFPTSTCVSTSEAAAGGIATAPAMATGAPER